MASSPRSTWGSTGGNQVSSVLDTSVLFAMIVYAILALAVRALIDWLTLRLDRLDRGSPGPGDARATDGT